MHPVLINLGPIPIHTYGFLVATGFLIAVAVIKKLALQSRMNVDRILDLCFWCLLIGFLGGRTLFIITRFEDFLHRPLDIFKIWEGGLVFLGGPIVVIPFVIWYVRKYKLPIWATMDVLTPGLVIAHAFGRFGCLSAGCCYGKPTGTSFGIRLDSPLVEPSLRGVPLHPTQLYEAAALIILFFGLVYLYRRKFFDGQVVLTYFLAYPIIRSIIEVFRGDLIRGFVIDDVLSTSQFISIIIFLIAGGVLWYRLQEVQHKPRVSSRVNKKNLSKKG